MTCSKCGKEMKFLPPPTGNFPLGTYVCECGFEVDKKS